MELEQELKMSHFQSEHHKAQLNILFTASWLRNLGSHYLKNHDLSHEQYNVLRILRGQSGNPLCVRDITARMIDKSSNTTRIIDKLESKEMLARQASQADRRELQISITPKGLEVLKALDEDFGILPKNTLNLTDSEAHILNKLLDKLRDMKCDK